jgi:hypothetical protein
MKLGSRIGLICLVLFVASCGPDLSNLDLSGCIDDCNSTAKSCLNTDDTNLEKCEAGDAACEEGKVKNIEGCFTDCLSCISACADEVQKRFK